MNEHREAEGRYNVAHKRCRSRQERLWYVERKVRLKVRQYRKKFRETQGGGHNKFEQHSVKIFWEAQGGEYYYILATKCNK